MIDSQQKQLTCLFLQSKLQSITKQNSNSNIDSIHDKNQKLQVSKNCRFKNYKENIRNQKNIFKGKIKNLQMNIKNMEKKYDQILFQLSKQIQKKQTKNNQLKFQVLKMKMQFKQENNDLQILVDYLIYKQRDQEKMKRAKPNQYILESRRKNQKKLKAEQLSKILYKNSSRKNINYEKNLFENHDIIDRFYHQKQLNSQKHQNSTSKKFIKLKKLSSIIQEIDDQTIQQKAIKSCKNSAQSTKLASRAQSPQRYKCKKLTKFIKQLQNQKLKKWKSQTFIKKKISFPKLKILIA